MHSQILLVRLTFLWLILLETLSEINTRRLTSRITMTEGVAKVYLHQCVSFLTPGGTGEVHSNAYGISTLTSKITSGLFKICVLLLTNEFHCSMTLFKQKGLVGMARDGPWIETHRFHSGKHTGSLILTTEFRMCLMITQSLMPTVSEGL